MSKVNPGNKCSHLFDQYGPEDKLTNPVKQMFDMQKSLQKFLSERGRGMDFDKADFMDKVHQINDDWKNLTLEFAELVERLPHKSWKTYTEEQMAGFTSEEEKLEVWYEYVDMLHFFMNIGLALGLDGETVERLYVTKNKENFDRQKRGY